MSRAPAWEAELRTQVAAFKLIATGDRMLGRVSAHAERTRLDVVTSIQAALAPGATERDIDLREPETTKGPPTTGSDAKECAPHAHAHRRNGCGAPLG